MCQSNVRLFMRFFSAALRNLDDVCKDFMYKKGEEARKFRTLMSLVIFFKTQLTVFLLVLAYICGSGFIHSGVIRECPYRS